MAWNCHGQSWRCLLIATALTLLLALSGVVRAAGVTGDEVNRATRSGVRAIRAAQVEPGRWPDRNQAGGTTCLAVLALVQAGERLDSTAVSAGLKRIRQLPNKEVYTTALKVMVLAKTDPKRYRSEISAAADFLIKAQNRSGLWSYRPISGSGFDHSNSQFALLGLHAAAQAGTKIPARVWKRARQTVIRTQNDDGGWAYRASGGSYGSMTAAGVADLLIVGDQIQRGQERGFRGGAAPNCGKYRASKPLAAGLDWLGRQFRPDGNPHGNRMYTYYWLYAVERCGILSGRRTFGPHDWYRTGAAHLVWAQSFDGTWNGSFVDTCFAVLFLSKGHKSLLIQKLQWSADDEWNPDRRAVAHLIAFIGDKLDEPVAWQVVQFDAPLEDWLAAPILYMQGHTFPEWDAGQRAKLRKFVEQGGTLLAEACCSREAFRTGFERFAAQAFPDAPLHPLGPEHAVYRVLYEIRPFNRRGKFDAYDLRGIDLGCRTSVIYSPHDLSCLWEQADIAVFSEEAFKLGTNIAAYAVGRRPLRDRLDTVVVPEQTDEEPGPPPQDAFRLAQVVYEGDWRPFPLALVNLAEFLRVELNFDVVSQYRQVRLSDAALYTSPILYLAGHYEFELSDAERTALAAHLRRGGLLLADACCGTQPFDESFRRLMQQVLPEQRLERLPADHPIFIGAPGFDVTTVDYSLDVMRAAPRLRRPELWGVELDGRLAVVYSPYSLGCGLNGPAFDGCWGLASEDAHRLTANIILYALTH